MLNFFRIFKKNVHLEGSLQYQITIKSQKQVLHHIIEFCDVFLSHSRNKLACSTSRKFWSNPEKIKSGLLGPDFVMLLIVVSMANHMLSQAVCGPNL